MVKVPTSIIHVLVRTKSQFIVKVPTSIMHVFLEFRRAI